MSNKQTSTSRPSVKHDGVAILCAIIGGMVGALLSYQVVRLIRFLTIEHVNIDPQEFTISIAAAILIVIVGAALGGIIGESLGRLITKWLAPQLEQTILNAAEKASKRPQRRRR